MHGARRLARTAWGAWHRSCNWRCLMVRTAPTLTVALAALGLVLLGSGRVAAQTLVVSPLGVAYYSPPPAVTYYSPPVVYTPAPAVSYYATPAAVTTTRYGVFGRPRVSTTYYPPV